MNVVLNTLFLLTAAAGSCAAQKSICFCAGDPELQERLECDTIHLESGGLLYYQYNCDSLWLTYKRPKLPRLTLYKIEGEEMMLANLNYRLGYQLMKEYPRSLLFRYGCPANGPCMYSLLDKQSGKVLRTYDDLIVAPTSGDFHDFLLYFGAENKTLVLEWVTSGKKYVIAVNPQHFTEPIPTHQFEDVVETRKQVLVKYADSEGRKHSLVLDLVRFPR